MNGKSCLITLGAAVATMAFSDHAFAQCQGNACSDLVVQQQGGCVILVNRNPRQAIKVTSNAVPSTVYDVYASSQVTPSVYGGSGACHRNWYHSFTANYSNVLPSRMFGGPAQYPPKQFKAYGIIAFKTLPTRADKERYDMICEAYVASLILFKEAKAPPQEQMVTVWPIESATWADRLNGNSREKVCADAVPRYGLAIAQEAIGAARKNKATLDGQGPFLLAWSPGAEKGQPDALVLVSDMSDVANIEQSKQVFAQWALDIQNNPELWYRGWDKEKLKLIVRLWADKWGTKVLSVFNMKP